MFVRIVKLSFLDKHVHEFITIFENSKLNIRNFEGCQFLEINSIPIYFSHNNYWNSKGNLNNYRHSVFFMLFRIKQKCCLMQHKNFKVLINWLA